MKIDSIIFDLGNVLLGFDHMRACRTLAKVVREPPERIFESVFRSGLEEAYDLGRLSSGEFARKVAHLLSTSLTEEELRMAWTEIFYPIPGMDELVRSLQGRYKLLLLSNTNEWHFAYCLEHFEVVRRFDHHLLSFRLGVKKPDPVLFEKALELAGVGPGECLFIDDVEDYVEAARRSGLKALQFQGYEGLVKAMTDLGIVTALV